MGEKETYVCAKVWLKKSGNQKLVTVPSDCHIVEGDYVYIVKIQNPPKSLNSR